MELCDAYILESYDWQADVIESWLAIGEDGKYAHPTCGIVLPRQNGKSKCIVAARMFVGAVFYGEKIRYSAHRVDTMLEMWEIFVNLFGDPRLKQWDFPELHNLVKRISLQNGHLFISLKNGAVINFVARSTGSGRGNTVDVNIYDEAQTLTETQLAAALPSQSAAPSGNPQVIYIGTPPDYEEASGEVFGRVRSNAIKGAEGIAWHEWSVDEIGDVSDKTRWYATNPSLGLSLLESAVENEYNNMSEEKFARERLAYWSDRATDKAIDDDAWNDTKVEEPCDSQDNYFLGIKFAPGGNQVAVSSVIVKEDGTTYGELAINEVEQSGLQWLIDRILAQRENIAMIGIDGKSGAGELAQRLLDAQLPNKQRIHPNAVHVLSSQEVVVAATMLNSSLEEKTLTHRTDKILDISAHSATKRKIGTDGYGFGNDSIPIESMAIANWIARTGERKCLLRQKTAKAARR